MTDMLDRIKHYYRQIDLNALHEIEGLFAETAVYRRADRTYDGKSRIMRFFREERRIRGRHVIESIWEVPDHIVAVGVFDGVGEKGDPRTVGFTDVWTLGTCNKVTERRTYLATGHAIVER